MTVWRYHKIATVLAEQQLKGGQVVTPEGIMRYEAGDYLVTDNPPTHVWPVKRSVFEETYRRDPYPVDDDTPTATGASYRYVRDRFKE